MKSILESHGATVEKFIGDAVMAVFGVLVLHEDDALRAVRAAQLTRVRTQSDQFRGASWGGILADRGVVADKSVSAAGQMRDESGFCHPERESNQPQKAR
jgi:class 3 adenylate cyclase